MAYLAYYRTFRPSTFQSVVRQEHIVTILKNQIRENKIGHAYLFCGPRGTGKTSIAKIFAKAINCENPVDGSPCGKCPTCRALSDASNLDISEIDAASNNGVDEMRDLREKVQYPPVAGKYKVYIIDEVHMLTTSAFNAVLKTLEEPPHHAVFILATTEPQKIPATILSRCMRFDFKLIPQKDLEDLIKRVYQTTGKEYEEEAITAIARAGAGCARDCLSIADMCASFSQGKLTYEDVNTVLGSADFERIVKISAAILNQDCQEAFSLVEEILQTGKGVGVLVRDLLNVINQVAIVKMCRNAKEIINLPQESYQKIATIAQAVDGHKILRATEVLSKAEADLRYSLNGRITLETAVMKCAMPELDYNLDAILGRIAHLEEQLKKGVVSVVEPTKQEIKAETQPIRPKIIEEKLEETIFTQASKPVQAEVKQPAIWEEKPIAPKNVGSLTDKEKNSIYAKFIRLLRTTRKNIVLFTICTNVETTFEGDKFIIFAENETEFRALSKEDNNRYIAETLQELGVFSHEVRLKNQTLTEREMAKKQLIESFPNTEIIIK